MEKSFNNSDYKKIIYNYGISYYLLLAMCIPTFKFSHIYDQNFLTTLIYQAASIENKRAFHCC